MRKKLVRRSSILEEEWLEDPDIGEDGGLEGYDFDDPGAPHQDAEDDEVV